MLKSVTLLMTVSDLSILKYSIFRPHHMHSIDAAYSYRWSRMICLLVGQSAGHDHEPCNDGQTVRDADWTFGDSRNHVLDGICITPSLGVLLGDYFWYFWQDLGANFHLFYSFIAVFVRYHMQQCEM